MNLQEIANNILKTTDNESWVDIDDLAYELGINQNSYYNDYADNKLITCYFVADWICTDTVVGYRIYFLDGEPVAFSVQQARKSDEKFYWFSERRAHETKDYILSLTIPQKETLNVNLCSLTDDIGEGFNIEYNSNLWGRKEATLQGERVEIIEHINDCKYGVNKKVKVLLENKTEKTVELKDLLFPYNIEQKEA